MGLEDNTEANMPTEEGIGDNQQQTPVTSADPRMEDFDNPPATGKKSNNELVNKRIDFDPKTLKRIEMMVPAFRDEVGSSASTNDVMSYIIARGIDTLFDGDFKKKIEEM